MCDTKITVLLLKHFAFLQNCDFCRCQDGGLGLGGHLIQKLLTQGHSVS